MKLILLQAQPAHAAEGRGPAQSAVIKALEKSLWFACFTKRSFFILDQMFALVLLPNC